MKLKTTEVMLPVGWDIITLILTPGTKRLLFKKAKEKDTNMSIVVQQFIWKHRKLLSKS